MYRTCLLQVLSKDTDEFKMLVEYVANTHAATHNLYTLTVMEVTVYVCTSLSLHVFIIFIVDYGRS